MSLRSGSMTMRTRSYEIHSKIMKVQTGQRTGRIIHGQVFVHVPRDANHL